MNHDSTFDNTTRDIKDVLYIRVWTYCLVIKIYVYSKFPKLTAQEGLKAVIGLCDLLVALFLLKSRGRRTDCA